MNLYFYDGKKLSGKASQQMALECLKAYIDEWGEPEERKEETGVTVGKSKIISKWEIKKGPHGKPFTPGVNLEFNISHSGLLWVCAVSEYPVGIDIQEVKEADCEGIAKRFFTPEEQHYVELWGSDGFFDLWVRKEAFVKYLGRGFSGSGGFDDFSLLDEKGDLKDSACLDGERGEFMIPDMGFDIKCAICAKTKDVINLRAIG